MMSKTAWVGSLAAALLASGCAVSGPSLFPGFWVFLDAPEDSECAGDCPEATVASPTAEEQQAEAEAEVEPEAESAPPPPSELLQ
ncbi:MAG: hypothetical protein BGO98_37430 [Myxococcales bacterium 68-20]|nr:hypothetical protein [Myxococcales bacterium]OJY22273.1 MAG: hypothetical protein BGO98_37430 [Myxococcales bacterium 68-20]